MELAVALPAVVLALTLLLCVMKVGTARVAAERAAATAARMVAVGTSSAEMTSAVRRAGGEAANVTAHVENGWVTAEVSIPIVANWGIWRIGAKQTMPTEEHLVGLALSTQGGGSP